MSFFYYSERKRNFATVLIVAVVTLFYNNEEEALNVSNQIDRNEDKNATADFRCSNTKLNCSEWIVDAFDDVLKIPHGQLISQGENATEMKLCELNGGNFDQDMHGKRESDGLTLPSGTMLIKCNNALVKFGDEARVTCGHPRPSNDNLIYVRDVNVLLAADLPYWYVFQHNVQNGLGNAASIWNFVNSEVPNLHILTGVGFKDLYIHLSGSVDRVHQVFEGSKTMWFRRLYLGGVSQGITPRSQLPVMFKEKMKRIQYQRAGDAMLPCSVHSMDGFQEWRADFTLPEIEDSQRPTPANDTLLYLQRIGNDQRRYRLVDCVRNAENATCSCRAVHEEEFVTRLKALSHRHGMEMETFTSSGGHKVFESNAGQKLDAVKFSQARVIVGLHGGAFTNMIFVDPALDAILIETNIHSFMSECCGKQIGSTRHFFTQLAASLGHRHITYQPHIWGGYGNGKRITLEVNDYLDFLDNTLSGKDTDEDNLVAPFHPCVPWMVQRDAHWGDSLVSG